MLLDKTAPFFMLDKTDKTVQTKAGPCTLPIRYFSACNVMMFFAVDHDRARLLLPNRQFEPLPNEQGKALALVGFWDYFDTSIGPYNESTISLMVTYPGFDLPGCYANPGSGRQEPDQHLRISELPVRVGSDLRGRQQGGALTAAVVPIAARALRTALKRGGLCSANDRWLNERPPWKLGRANERLANEWLMCGAK